MNKTEVVRMRCTAKELETLKQAAYLNDVKVSTYIRIVALEDARSTVFKEGSTAKVFT